LVPLGSTARTVPIASTIPVNMEAKYGGFRIFNLVYNIN
jgi:hypothetical protein